MRDAQALRLGKDATVVTPKLCVTPERPHLRFVAQSAPSGGLDVRIRFYDSYGNVADSSSGSISPSDHAVWAPSRDVALKVDRLAPGEVAYVDVRFTSKGDWRVDDVFIDPYRR